MTGIFLGLMFALPAIALGATTDDSLAWRVGLGAGLFQMSSNYPGSPYTFRKRLPGYQLNLGYMITPAIEGGLLITGGGKGTDNRGGSSIELKLPVLPQAYLRTRQYLGGRWGLYEMISLGAMTKRARNATGTLVVSERSVIVGVGAGLSWQGGNPDWGVDVGILMPGIALKRSSVLNTRMPGIVLALNYAFGQDEDVQQEEDAVVLNRRETAPASQPMLESKPTVVAVAPSTIPLAVKPNEPLVSTPSTMASTVSIPPAKLVDQLVAVSHFRSGRTDIDAKTQRGLVQLAARLSRMKDNASIEIRGYADGEPIGGYPGHKHQSIHAFHSQIALTRARAQVIAKILIKHGINALRIVVHGYGASAFIADNATVFGRNKNRRVEVHLISNGNKKGRKGGVQ